MSGRRWLQPHEIADIVAAVIKARAQGVGWKDLEERFDMSRRQLLRHVSRETMSQQISGMSQRGDCAAGRAA